MMYVVVIICVFGGVGGSGGGGGGGCLVPHPRAPPGEKRSGERSRAYSPKVVMTNEIARSVIITWHFPYNSKLRTQVSIPFLSGFGAKHC